MFIVTRCDVHGTTETTEYESFVVYVGLASDNEPSWVCCSRMVIDPHGILDY